MPSDEILKGSRREYERCSLDENAADPCPLLQFKAWFEIALQSEAFEANACALATVGKDGQPAVRMVLLKAFDQHGFVFFTNYQSRKGAQLRANPRAALLFYWPSLEQQVRLEGSVEEISSADTDSYFYSRPKETQLGAAVSLQSQVVSSRYEIDESYMNLAKQIGDERVPRPAHWGGYRLRPESFEFWQGRQNRLHDRLRYTRAENTEYGYHLIKVEQHRDSAPPSFEKAKDQVRYKLMAKTHDKIVSDKLTQLRSGAP